jgi:hypothetical protein
MSYLNGNDSIRFISYKSFSRYYIKIEIKNHKLVFYLPLNKECCVELNINEYDFTNILNTLNAKFNLTNDIYFETNDDANNAIEWLNSLLMAKKLQGE